MSQLQTLNLSFNFIEGIIPPQLGKLPNLTVLDLANNKLSSNIPSSIFNISSLQVIDFGYNSFSGNIPQKIDLSNNNLTGPLPASLFNISTLRLINLRNNEFGGELPQEMCQRAHSLEQISILNNNVGGSIPRSIGNCTTMKRLFLGNNLFTDEGQSKTYTNNFATFGYVAPEFGSKGIVSIKGDVYSYGVMLMEVFTRRKPTDEIFVDGLSLISWIQQSMAAGEIVHVVDPDLLEGSEEHVASTKKVCLSSIMELALNCCADSPEKRSSMKDVVDGLNKIKTYFLQMVIGSPF
ncbi:hypothetical protein L6164_036949 [Bauhinia variegata]|uniref:Uncharacterized protein n=1 Tax=Bauhinia variegata TaxID=167791 RepID=A0ACB9KIG7_BAUVA|nr:hypothetical protein L6164_036949 [Bauhinia variegata]